MKPTFDSTPANDDGDQSEDDEDGAMFNVDAVIDLSLTKTASVETTSPGEEITWTLTVTNDVENANAAATNVQITDVMPDGLSITDSSASGNGQFSDGVWSLVDPLEPGAMATLTLTTTVDGNIQAGDHTNTAQVTAADQDDVDSTPGNDDGDQSEDDEAADTVAVEPQIDLELTKSGQRQLGRSRRRCELDDSTDQQRGQRQRGCYGSNRHGRAARWNRTCHKHAVKRLLCRRYVGRGHADTR